VKPMPAGACDCHIHFYGTREQYPLAPTAVSEPPLATVEQYRRVMATLGTERMVLVQPSAYGTDNRCLVDGLRALGPVARGVVTVRPDVADADLAAFDAVGVRAARALMFPGAVLAMNELPALAARIAPFGWHIQLQLDGRTLPQHEPMLAALPVPLVIDHNGKFVEPVTPDHPGMRTLLRLLDSGRCWVKASAPYETSRRGPPRYEDVGIIARALVEHAPDRVVWASNWPHGGMPEPRPDDATLLAVLDQWAPDPEVRRRILVDNPRELYGYA